MSCSPLLSGHCFYPRYHHWPPGDSAGYDRHHMCSSFFILAIIVGRQIVGRAPSALISVTMSLSLLHLDLRRPPHHPGSVMAVLRRSFSLSIYCSGPAHTLSTPFVFLLATLRPFAPIDGHRRITATTTATRTCSHMAWCTPPCRWLLEAGCRQRNFWCPTRLEGGLGQVLH